MITVAVHEPLALGTAQIENLTGAVISYSHTIRAMGGFWSARIRVDGRKVDLEEWYENGLDRRIVVYSPDALQVWEGFVNIARINYRGIQKSTGPVIDIQNRVKVLFPLVESGGFALGLTAETGWTNNTDSQERYFSMEGVYAASDTTLALAEQARDMLLLQRAWPARTEDIALTRQQGDSSLELECLGYVHRLNTYTYNQESNANTTIEGQIAYVLDISPGNLFSSANTLLEPSGVSVPEYENDNRRVWSIIKGLCALGDQDLNRYLFGVYLGRQCRGQVITQQVDYTQSVNDTHRQARTPLGALIEPWYVLPGKWLLYTDFLVGRGRLPSDLRTDPRFAFIEAVIYTAPHSLVMQGGQASHVTDRLARMGLSGVGG